MEAAAGRRDRLEPVAPPELVRVHHLAVEEPEDERIVLRQKRDDRCADTRLGGGDRVVRLVLAVDREQPRVPARDPDDVAALGGGDLVVRVREAARERLDVPLAAQLRHRLQDVLQGHRPIL